MTLVIDPSAPRTTQRRRIRLTAAASVKEYPGPSEFTSPDQNRAGQTPTPDPREVLVRPTQHQPPEGALALVSIADARRRLGGIGTTKFYADARKYGLRIIAFGGRSMVRNDDLVALIELLTEQAAATTNRHSQRAESLAAKALAARRITRGVAGE